MIDFKFNETQMIELIKGIFTISIGFAFLIILIFNYYRSKYLTLTKKH